MRRAKCYGWNKPVIFEFVPKRNGSWTRYDRFSQSRESTDEQCRSYFTWDRHDKTMAFVGLVESVNPFCTVGDDYGSYHAYDHPSSSFSRGARNDSGFSGGIDELPFCKRRHLPGVCNLHDHLPRRYAPASDWALLRSVND